MLSLALTALDRILRAIRNRIDVSSSAADRVARRRGQRDADQGGSGNFLNHELSSLR